MRWENDLIRQLLFACGHPDCISVIKTSDIWASSGRCKAVLSHGYKTVRAQSGSTDGTISVTYADRHIYYMLA